MKAATAASDAVWKCLMFCPLPTGMQRVVHEGLFWFGNHEFTVEGGYLGLTFCPLFDPDDKNKLGVMLEVGQTPGTVGRRPKTWWRIMFKGETLLLCEDAGPPDFALEGCTAAYCNLRYTCDALLITGERPEALRKHIDNGLLDYDPSEWDAEDTLGVMSIFDLVKFPNAADHHWTYTSLNAFFCRMGDYSLMITPGGDSAGDPPASWTVFYRSPRTGRSSIDEHGTGRSLDEARHAALAYCSSPLL
jgi:hypothetical protein